MALSRTDLENRFNGPIPAEMLAQLDAPKAAIAERPIDELLEDLADQAREVKAEWKGMRYTCDERRKALALSKRSVPTWQRIDAEKAARLERFRLRVKADCYAAARRKAAEIAAEIARRFPVTVAAE